MAEQAPRLTLLSPHGVDAGAVDALVAGLAAACSAGDVAAVLLRLAAAEERALINLVKRIAPTVQEHGAALVITCSGYQGDLASVAARGGVDGVHLDKPDEETLRESRGRLREGRILGAGGLETRHASMAAGEAGIDYLMVGGLYPDGAAPDADAVLERAAWWAEIFETPCIAVAAREDEIAALAQTGAEFVGLESAIWLADPGAVGRAQAALRRP